MSGCYFRFYGEKCPCLCCCPNYKPPKIIIIRNSNKLLKKKKTWERDSWGWIRNWCVDWPWARKKSHIRQGVTLPEYSTHYKITTRRSPYTYVVLRSTFLARQKSCLPNGTKPSKYKIHKTPKSKQYKYVNTI